MSRAERYPLRVIAALSGLVIIVGGCQRVGVVPTEAPVPVAHRPVVPEMVGAGPGPIRAMRIEPMEVRSAVDVILHSTATSDPALQARVNFWVDFWMTRGAGHFGRYLERMAIYEGLVERELEDRGLPPSLKYLPIVESGYLDGAVSRVGATGLWQIMTPTARGLGLTVNALVDDRRDPIASTRAALDYLQEMHETFGSWFMALAAYNAGPGRIRGVVNRWSTMEAAVDDMTYVTLRPRLPAETREFVPRFLAAAKIAQSPEEYGFRLPEPGSVAALAYEEVVVPDATSLDIVAEAAGVAEGEIRLLNPQYLRGFTPVGESRAVRVPPGTAERFEVAYALISPEERISFIEHVVARGETLSGIANRYGIRLAELQAANGRVDPRRMQIGQRLVVPVAGAGAGARRAPATAVEPTSPESR